MRNSEKSSGASEEARPEDISRRNLNTERRRELDKAEEQKAKRAQLEIEEKLLQRKTETFRKLQIPIMINYDYDKFAASKKEHATTMALHLDLLYTCCL